MKNDNSSPCHIITFLGNKEKILIRFPGYIEFQRLSMTVLRLEMMKVDPETQTLNKKFMDNLFEEDYQ